VEGSESVGLGRISFDLSRRAVTRQRHVVFVAASAAAHAALLATVIFLVPAPARPGHDWVVAYLLNPAAMGGGNGGPPRTNRSNPPAGVGPRMGRPSARHRFARSETHRVRITIIPRAHDAAAATARLPAPPAAEKVPPNLVAARVRTEPVAASGPVRADSHTTASSFGSGGAVPFGGRAGETSFGVGGGSGSGGSLASADYDANPPPPYPARARRLGEQGTVTLRILVAADGSVANAEIAHSSGFDTLDRAALETVRTRWRFVPARRAGAPVKSWVLVPIRFALSEASAAD
jgi:periplasmic protein TonB